MEFLIAFAILFLVVLVIELILDSRKETVTSVALNDKDTLDHDIQSDKYFRNEKMCMLCRRN